MTRQWLELAERRLAYYDELYRSGRWARYFATEEHFARRMIDVITVCKTFRRLVARQARAREDNLRPAA
jgi:hypothetical protein